MDLENAAREIGKGITIFGIPIALFFGATGVAGAQDIGKTFFEANYWEDIYGDNNIHYYNGYPQGYHGIKSNFKDNEEIIFVGHDPGWAEGDDVEYVLKRNGKVVLHGGGTIESDGEWYHAGESIDEDLMHDLMHSDNGGVGHYEVDWYDGEEFCGFDEFDVSSSN